MKCKDYPEIRELNFQQDIRNKQQLTNKFKIYINKRGKGCK